MFHYDVYSWEAEIMLEKLVFPPGDSKMDAGKKNRVNVSILCFVMREK